MPTPMPLADIITAGSTAIVDLGLYGFLLAGAVIGIAAFVFRKFGGKAR